MLITVGAAIIALLVSNSQTRKYKSTAELLFTTKASESLFGGSNAIQSVDPGRALATEIKLLQGQTVRGIVADKIGSAPNVLASADRNDNVISITATSASPARAASVANAYAAAYIENRQASTVDDITSAQKAIQRKIDELQGPISDLDKQIAALPKDQTNILAGLENNRQALLGEQSLYRQQVNQLQLRADLTGGVQVVTPAPVPTVPFAPTPRRTTVLAGGMGLMLGIGIAFLLDVLDDSIKSETDIELANLGLPILASIPVVPGWKNKQSARLVSVEDPTSVTAEAYRRLRTAIQFMGIDRPIRTIQVTSPSAAEGKSSTLSNLAVALARAGQKVVVVDCDLRRPRAHSFFGVSNDTGFTSAMVNAAPLGAVVKSVVGQPRILVAPSGPVPPNPSELLSTKRAGELLDAVKAQSDVVMVDSSPVLPVTDAAVLSKWVDATVIVVRAGETTRRELHRAVDILRQVDAKLVGLVLNGVSIGDSGSPYKYEYRPSVTPEAADAHPPEPASLSEATASGDGQNGHSGWRLTQPWSGVGRGSRSERRP